jgi:hypothetical protein
MWAWRRPLLWLNDSCGSLQRQMRGSILAAVPRVADSCDCLVFDCSLDSRASVGSVLQIKI